MYEVAEYANLSQAGKEEYEVDLKLLRDTTNSVKSALVRGREEGETEGIRKEKIETARRMLKEKMSVRQIAMFTGLAEGEIKALKD